jgi:hypothetical protein
MYRMAIILAFDVVMCFLLQLLFIAKLQVEGGYRTSCYQDSCISVLRLPTFALAGELRLTCAAQVGRLYFRQVEGLTRLIPPPQPIQGVPLTSLATLPRVGFDFVVVIAFVRGEFLKHRRYV